MTTDQIAALNARYAIPGRVALERGPGDLPFVRLHGDHADGTIALQGATTTGYEPSGSAPVLWISRASHYAPDRAIRGGIPLCWPWFGPHPSDPSKPQHGFVRTRPWTVLGASVAADGATEVRLGLDDSAETRALWPHAFRLALTVQVGASLHVALDTHNTGDEPFTFTGALHSYFDVADATAITIDGLDRCSYVDQVDARRVKLQQGPVTISAETDRVYQDTTATCTIDDPTRGRRIKIAKEGSRSTVVWNPWRDKAQRMADFGDDEYLRMVCVEVANALDHAVTLAPGAQHRLATTISVEAA